MSGCCYSDLRSDLHRLINDENARNIFLRRMAPFSKMSRQCLLMHIRSACSSVSPEERRRHLTALVGVSQDRRFQTKEMRQKVTQLSNTINDDPPVFRRRRFFFPRRRFFGLGSLILLALLL